MDANKRRRWPWVLGIVLVTLVVAGVVGVQLLDHWLLGRARQEAQVYAQRLGRPIEIGSLSTKLLTGSGLRLENVRVGAAEGEGDLPLATLGHLDVRLPLWTVAKSRGKDLPIESVEIAAPELTVVRRADGLTNVEHVQRRLAETAPAEPAPSQESKPTDLSGVKLARFQLSDGRIRFVDLSETGKRELAIEDLDIAVKDLRAGAPLKVQLAAAVLSKQQNFELTLTSTPLPATLVPTPDQLAIKAQPIDLSPLAPFLSKEAGFLGGSFGGELAAKLGRAVPGGEGPTEVKGELRARGLRFSGQEGGKALDVTVQTDLSGDVIAGSLDLRKLEIDAGPAKISGHGKVSNLASASPSVEGLEVVGRNLDPAVLALYYPPLEKKLGGQVAGPIGFTIRGAGSVDAQSLAFDLDLTQTRVQIPEELTKAAGTPMRVTGNLRGSAKGVYGFDAQVDLGGADLRPGEILNKAPGDRFEIATRGTFQPAATPGDATRVRANTLTINLLDSTLNGSVSAELKGKTTSFDLAMKSPRVDADRLLLTDEQIEAAKPPAERARAPKPPVVKDPDRFDGLRGAMAFDIGSLRMKKVDLSKVQVKMKMVDDEITMEQLRADAYGGSITGDGTKIALGPAKRPFELNVKTANLEVGELLARGEAKKQSLAGKFNGNISLKGVGYELENLQQTLAGVVQGSLADGTFLGTDVVSAVSGPLARALPFASKALKSDGVTKLGDELPFGLTIENGVAKLKKPIQINRPEAALTFDGGIQLSGDLNLAGTVSLTPQTVSMLTGGKAVLKEPLPLALNLTGPAWKPTVSGLDVKPAVLVIAKQASASLAEKVIGDKFGAKGKAVTDAVQGNTDALKQQAEQKAAQERARAEQAAAEEKAKAEARLKEESAKAKQRAEEEAKKRLRGLFGGGGN